MFKEFLRNIRKMQTGNDGSRTLYESVMVPEVISAMQEWSKNSPQNYVIIGGVALSFHVKPRQTEDMDVLYKNKSDFPQAVNGFRKNRNHSFEHKKTGVEIEILDPEFLNIPSDIVDQIFKEAIISDGMRIASKDGLIVSKLFRFNRRDQADIEDVWLNYNGDVDLSSYNLSKDLLDKYYSIADTLTTMDK